LKITIFHTALAFDTPVRGVPIGNIAIKFGEEKLEWSGSFTYLLADSK